MVVSSNGETIRQYNHISKVDIVSQVPRLDSFLFSQLWFLVSMLVLTGL